MRRLSVNMRLSSLSQIFVSFRRHVRHGWCLSLYVCVCVCVCVCVFTPLDEYLSISVCDLSAAVDQ